MSQASSPFADPSSIFLGTLAILVSTSLNPFLSFGKPHVFIQDTAQKLVSSLYVRYALFISMHSSLRKKASHTIFDA